MNRKKSFMKLSKIRYKVSLSLIKMSEFQVPVSHRSTRSEKDVKSYMEPKSALANIVMWSHTCSP